MPPTNMLKPQGGPAHTSGIFADMTVDGPIIGDLVLVVDRARNLPNRKTMGKQDPYCAARLGKEAKKTDTDKRGGQTPRWDQELRFVVHESPDYLKLKMSVFNEDRKTELIGETWIDLSEVIVRGGGQNDGWHRLNCKGRAAGEVRMEITFYDTREKPVEAPAKPSRQTEQLNGGPRGMPGRRPLPRGPGGAEAPAIRAAVPHSASTSQIPSRQPRPETILPRHMSTDATEHGPVDPYKHRQKMLATYGLPFDPNAVKDDERLMHHGGPRPVPGQGFSDLDRLRYRNRGVTIPEGLVQEEQENRHRRNTHEIPPPSQPESEFVYNPDSPAIHDLHLPQHYQPQERTSHPIYNEQAPQQIFEQDPQTHGSYDYQSQQQPDQSAYHQPYIEEEEDEAPPPPPAHRSNIASSTPTHSPHHMQFEPEPPAPSLQHGLARLNRQNGDDFYHPVENSTQLTTHSDMAAPGHSDVYNHGHRPSPRSSQVPQGSYPGHQRSMQDMRGYSADSGYGQYNSPSYQTDRSIKRLSYNHRSEAQDDFRSSGPPLPAEQYSYHGSQMQLHRRSGYDLAGSGDEQHFQDSRDHTYHTPLVKPRAVSPNVYSPHYQPPSASPSTPQHTPHQASGYNSQTNSIPRKSIELRLSDVAFSPDSFDVLNPQVKSARPSVGDPDSMTQSPYANGGIESFPTPAHDPNEPIRDSTGRLVDPSDHLPTHTWAPEPEPKKPLKAEVKLRFKGAVPMPTSTPRAPRPDVGLPAVKSSVQSPHLTDRPGENGDANAKESRNRLQKKVRVLMTSGGRRERERAPRLDASSPIAGTNQPLRDIPSVNYGSGVADAPPPLPAKIPMGYEENMGMDALSREISGIDLGSYDGRGNRRTRFSTTIM